MVSHLLNVKVSPEWRVNPSFGTQKMCPFPLNRGVPSIVVTNTKIMRAFFWDQILCLLNGDVPWIEVSQRRGSIVADLNPVNGNFLSFSLISAGISFLLKTLIQNMADTGAKPLTPWRALCIDGPLTRSKIRVSNVLDI